MELNDYFNNLINKAQRLSDDISAIIANKKDSDINSEKKERLPISKRSLEKSYVLRKADDKINEDPDIQFIIDQTNNIFSK